MVKAIAIAMSLAVASAATQSVPARVVTLQDLTVPAAHLPAGCALAPAPSVPAGQNRVRGGMWVGLRIATNPWIGTDPYVIATIRSRMEPSPPVPDGPPLHRRAAASYFLHIADGVEEAYAAVYAQDERDLVAVYASRLAVAERSGDRLSNKQEFKSAQTTRIDIGPIAVMVSGGAGECSDAIEAYVKSLASTR
jgi:hypothetical protein